MEFLQYSNGILGLPEGNRILKVPLILEEGVPEVTHLPWKGSDISLAAYWEDRRDRQKPQEDNPPGFKWIVKIFSEERTINKQTQKVSG